MRASFRQGSPADRLPTRSASACSRTRARRSARRGARRPARPAGRVGRGEGRASRRPRCVHPDGAIGAARVITVGLGKRDEFDAERARIAAAVALRPRASDAARAGARVGRARGRRPGGDRRGAGRGHAARRLPLRPLQEPRRQTRRRGPEQLEIVSRRATSARPSSEARHRGRAPERRARPPEPARERRSRRRSSPSTRSSASAEIDGLEARRSGPTEIGELEMGGLLAVAQGSHQEPRFIVLRYDGGGRRPRWHRRQGGDVRHRRHLDQARRARCRR